MDEQVARPPADLARLLHDFVCVRVTNMRDVDLSRYVFDYDLTFAILLMNADGTTYHRYGGRDHKDPMGWMSLPSLTRVMRMTLVEHALYQAKPAPPKLPPSRTIMDVEPFKERTKGKKIDCVHCHSLQPALREEAKKNGKWQPRDIWIYPTPEQIGIELVAAEQNRIRSVFPTSPAAVAELRAGDQLLRIGSVPIASYSDVQMALHRAPHAATELVVEIKRRNARQTVKLVLSKDWKIGSPLTFSWRPSKWDLQPSPGFGGKAVSEDVRKRLSIAAGDFAFEVGYLVTWGHLKRRGLAAREAGLRKGDVVVAVAGKRDFTTHDHFHAWFRLTRKVGETVPIEVVRGNERVTLQLSVIE
ncbi:MAG: Trx7/PDZ domain-containing (seleno)protein [Planctomycetota bacterium]